MAQPLAQVGFAAAEGFHTMTCYGDYLREVGYGLKRTGVKWENLSEA